MLDQYELPHLPSFVSAAVFALVCLACGGSGLPQVAGTLAQVLDRHRVAVNQATEKPLAIKQARLELGGWWSGQDDTFEGWTGKISSFSWCDDASTGCVELSVDVPQGNGVVRLSQVNLADYEAVDAFGEAMSPGWFDPLTVDESVLEPLLATGPPLEVGTCVVASGQVSPGLQGDDLRHATFFVEFETLRRCDEAQARALNSNEVFSGTPIRPSSQTSVANSPLRGSGLRCQMPAVAKPSRPSTDNNWPSGGEAGTGLFANGASLSMTSRVVDGCSTRTASS